METSWSLGILIGIPACILLILIIMAFVAFCLFEGEDGIAFGGVVALIVALGVMAFAFYPYSGEYHQWRGVSGTVESIDKRLIKDGDGMTERFVAQIDGAEYGCDDTRCAGVKVGDELTLSCKREWQYTGTDGYGCKYVGREAADR